MDCCSINGLDKVFKRSVAKREMKRCLKNGLDKRASIVADFLQGQDLSSACILEIGGGI